VDDRCAASGGDGNNNNNNTQLNFQPFDIFYYIDQHRPASMLRLWSLFFSVGFFTKQQTQTFQHTHETIKRNQ
jgi:hypothetical protein